jgi:cytochrome c-type biogenesis protein CcmH
MRRALAAFAGALLVAFAGPAFAQADEVAHPDAKVEARLKDLGEELRCLVCQNQTIADSQAPLALDLRNQIRTLIREGKSDDQIRAYMVDRYGDFVLYRPPFKATTLLLWIGPFALLVVGAGVLVYIARSRRAAERATRVAPEREREIARLLEEGESPPRGRG